MYSGRIERLLTQFSPLPMCAVSAEGKVTRASSNITDVFKYDGIIGTDIFQLTGLKLAEIIKAGRDGETLQVDRNNKYFVVIVKLLGEEDNPMSEILYFVDKTPYVEMKQKYRDDRTVIAMISIDNYDDQVVAAEDESDIVADLDKLIRGWAEKVEGSCCKCRDNLYQLYFARKNYEIFKESNFSILDESREIETLDEIPVTLSIGVGSSEESIEESEEFAMAALDLALGRGGDQAIVKSSQGFEYFGAKTEGAAKLNKGKSRVIATALQSLMKQSGRIFIMGHVNPDLDCFGASLGIYRFAKSIGKNAFIILNEHNETMTEIISEAKDTDDYDFITTERALELVDDNSLAIVVDAHRPFLIEAPEVIDEVARTAVIDHHRRAADAISDAALFYLEPYASSASELVTELLGTVCDKKDVEEIEADAMLAGITLDTNRFAVKAGVRTFEAASWLKRAGADGQRVRRYFQADEDNVRKRTECIAAAKIINEKFAFSVCQGKNENAQVINSQVADELLTIKGVEASFVAGKNEYGTTMVSARSLGTVNVQLIMEKFDGGGHMTTAGARSELEPEEILAEIEEFVKTSQ